MSRIIPSSFAFRPPPLVILYLSLAICLCACGTAATPPTTPVTLRVAGSTTMLPLLADLAAAYVEQHPHVRLHVEGGGSHVGLERLEMRETNLAACSWLPPREENTPQPYTATPIAWDGIAIVVHPDNAVDELTLLQVRHIYAGWTLDWQDVGGEARDIVIVSREDGSGTRAAFEQQVMGEEPVTLTAIVMPSSAAVVDYVARHQAAIGYVSMSYADPASVKVLRIEGALPSPATVRGVYHLSRPLYLVTPGRPSGEVRAFIDFALSPAGQAIVGKRYGRIR
ncbi:MAG: phosphate ABC transporter substrate-binding protein [Anaerolineae bacterium]|nr:phosphate ABC transporter substrate-binding protein [Anaerolineae bacterium]